MFFHASTTRLCTTYWTTYKRFPAAITTSSNYRIATPLHMFLLSMKCYYSPLLSIHAYAHHLFYRRPNRTGIYET